MKLFCSNYWQTPQTTAAIRYFQKQPPELFCKQGVRKKSQNSQEGTCAGVFYGHGFYRTAPVAAADYSELYSVISNSNSTSLDKKNYLDFIRM